MMKDWGSRMKKLDKKHKLAYEDVFLYTRLTSYFLNTNFIAEVSSPFTYKNGNKMDVWVGDDVIVGIGQRNFQRDRLYANRGKLIFVAEYHNDGRSRNEKIVGRWSAVKKEVTLFPTERLLPEEIKILSKIQKHLTENNVSVIIELDEKKRYRLEVRRRRGDRIQRRDIDVPHFGRDYEFYDDDEY